MLVHFGIVSHRLLFTVLDVDCPLVLGMPFLQDCNPVVDWKARSVTFAVEPSPVPAPANVFAALDPEVPLAPVDTSGVVASTVLPSRSDDTVQRVDTCCGPATCVPAPLVSFSGRSGVTPTTFALSACEKVGGFLPVFEAALRSVKRGKVLAALSCPHCSFPVLDTGRRVCFDGERTCKSCLRTFPAPSGVVGNPLADFVRDSRGGAAFLGTSPAPGRRSCDGGGATSTATSAAREKLVAVNGA